MTAAHLAEHARGIQAELARVQVPNATSLGPLWLIAWVVAGALQAARRARLGS
jgi:hypothetical protein